MLFSLRFQRTDRICWGMQLSLGVLPDESSKVLRNRPGNTKRGSIAIRYDVGPLLEGPFLVAEISGQNRNLVQRLARCKDGHQPGRTCSTPSTPPCCTWNRAPTDRFESAVQTCVLPLSALNSPPTGPPMKMNHWESCAKLIAKRKTKKVERKTERSHTMGDKGGKKDKAKSQKQKKNKDQQKQQKKQDRQQKKTP